MIELIQTIDRQISELLAQKAILIQSLNNHEPRPEAIKGGITIAKQGEERERIAGEGDYGKRSQEPASLIREGKVSTPTGSETTTFITRKRAVGED